MREQKTAPAGEPVSEVALLAATARGDRDAFQRLYFLFHRRLGRFLLRLTHRPDVTEEVINDTMLVVWQRAAEFRGDSRPSTWILGIAYRRALKALSRLAESRCSVPTEADCPCDEVAIEGLAQRAELADWLEAALSRLTPEQRLAIELSYMLGLSGEEIAAITRCPVNTVKTRMFYARRHLRQLLVTLATPTTSKGAGP